MNIKIYGADWCPDCVNAKKFLDDEKKNKKLGHPKVMGGLI